MAGCFKRLGLMLLVVVAGCGDDDGGAAGDGGGPDVRAVDARAGADAAGAFLFGGTVTGPAAAAGPVGVIWVVSAGSPDYSYGFGAGSSSGATFAGGLTSTPPTAARNVTAQAEFGVGVAILMAPGQSLPEGRLTSMPPTPVGLSARHAIIYRGPTDTGTVMPWTAAFPVGLSCGVCVDAPSGFDSFAPVDCAALVIDSNLSTPVCNWS